jgi:hypothetical protein
MMRNRLFCQGLGLIKPSVIFVGLACMFHSGCTGYEYELVQPAALARHIGCKAATSADVAPLSYSFEAAENHLVIWVRNPTADAVRILGDRSVIVDPSGQSHPMQSQTIAPASYVKLILPPLHTYLYGYGPPVVIWAGDGGGEFTFHRDFYSQDGPDYVISPDPLDPAYFVWEGETDLRLTLSFELKGKIFEQSFIFHQTKVH